MRKITQLCFSAALLSLTLTANVKAQELKYCGSTQMEHEAIRKNPDILRIQEELNRFTEQFQPSAQRTAGTIITIPIVFHIIHASGAENISDAQIHDQMRILNEDFRGRNADTSDVVPDFKNIVADSEIQFKLAQKDPSGNPTSGIDRINSPETNIGDDGSKLNGWPRNKYLNIWVVKTITSGAAGYAYKPASANSMPSVDGIMILSTYIGSVGTGTYGRARALTHEIGHYLNLDHVWGGTNQPGVDCTGNDNVADTPKTEGWTTCNLSGKTCTNTADPADTLVDNVQNFMEYAYCSRMYTEGQKTRMRAALSSSTAQRSSLWTTTNLAATGTDGNDNLWVADFKPAKAFVCVNTPLDFSDLSYHEPTSWSWSFPGATTTTSNVKNPTGIVYTTEGTYDVTLSVANGSGTKTITKSITVYPATAMKNDISYSEGFETINIPGEWTPLNLTGGNTWEKTTATGSTGTSSAKLTNLASMEGQVDELVGPSYNMTMVPDAKLTFKVAFAQRTSSSDDKLQVMISTNCGANWQTRYTKFGYNLATGGVNTGSFTPSATQWREETVSMLPYISYDKVWIKFVFTSDGGNNIYIDDINIMSPVGIDEKIADNLQFSVYPNPTPSNAEVSFDLASRSNVKLQLFDVIGREVEKVADGEMETGNHKYIVKSESGVYLVRLTVGNQVFVKRLVIN